MSAIAQKKNIAVDQYQDDAKLSARQAIYAYSQRQDNVWTWAASHYPFRSGDHVLEVGCGNGLFWLTVQAQLPAQMQLTLTDLSLGMMQQAQQKLWPCDAIEFIPADAENLQFDDNRFDAVLSHYMLYHVDSVPAALYEFKRVLKPNGFCGILLPDNHHMQSVFELLAIEYPIHAQPFHADMAMQLLPEFFSEVAHWRYQDLLKVDNVDTIVGYIRSLAELDRQSEAFYSDMRVKLHQYIKTHRFIEIEMNQHVFVVKV